MLWRPSNTWLSGFCTDLGREKTPGTLGASRGHGVGNPRDFVSGRVASLLKFNPLKLKGSIEKPLKKEGS